jgi:hemerythrin-like domain-containing protein
MQPIGPLMHEHRRIERMIELIKMERDRVTKGEEPDIHFLSSAADFFSVYADRCHHGKEEDILFKELEQRADIPNELEKIRQRLISEHEQARELVGGLRKAYEKHHLDGDEDAKKRIADILDDLAALYPQHIETEDKEFFFPVMELFSREKQDAMLEQFYAFDQEMIHEKYEQVVAGFEKD